MLDAAVRTLNDRLMDGYRHFEELRLFEPQVGSDRISDITCNVLKQEFIAYTRDLAENRGIPMERVPVTHPGWDRPNRRWLPPDEVVLPLNPFARRARGILLIPELPAEFNYLIARNIDKREIGARIARAHPDLARRYLDFREQNPKPAYDVHTDPDLRTRWYERGRDIARSREWDLPDAEDAFNEFIGGLVDAFAHWVQEQDGWRVLIHEGQPRAEKIPQSVFRAMTTTVCRDRDVDLTSEANAGRGPVDFKFSHGWSARALVEMKLAKNTRVGQGIKIQTHQYLRSEQIRVAYFIYIGFTEKDFSSQRQSESNEMAKEAAADAPEIEIRLKMVDAGPKRSASKA